MRLEVIDDATGKRRTEWAYAPFLAATENAWGPKASFIIYVNFGDDTEGNAC